MRKTSGQNTSAKYALLSVYDKTGIVDFAKTLADIGYTIISTGGTAKELERHGVRIVPIQDITGNPESFDGRMKTISFQIESGILFDRSNPTHVKEAEKLQIKPIDIVVCNLYPFEQTVSKPGVKLEEAIKSIDVGGPTMIRSAAKNFQNVLVVVDPNDYALVGEYLSRISRHPEPFGHSERSEESSSYRHVEDPVRAELDLASTSLRSRNKFGMTNKRSFADAQDDIRRSLAGKAFLHLSFYDGQISEYLRLETFPKEIALPGRKVLDLRYGENPHQKAAVYTTPNANSPFEHLHKLWGRDLSLTNVMDINAGLESVRVFEEPAVVVIKHNSPCGIALGKSIKEALLYAIQADPESAFGGVIILNKELDMAAAKVIAAFKDERRGNIDIIAAPSIATEALGFLQQVRKSMGIYVFGEIPEINTDRMNLKWIDGGFILQTGDDFLEKGFMDWRVVTEKKPTRKQLQQMQVAWKFVTKIRSNAVIIVDKKLPMTRGIGSGQTSRLRSTKISFMQAGKFAKDAILASDSFFPFDDSVKLASDHGVGAIVQQGGSINDQASIDAADKAGIPMVFTNRRAFWH